MGLRKETLSVRQVPLSRNAVIQWNNALPYPKRFIPARTSNITGHAYYGSYVSDHVLTFEEVVNVVKDRERNEQVKKKVKKKKD
jgi:hypothetical protein